jgi:hypothetical protein
MRYAFLGFHDKFTQDEKDFVVEFNDNAYEM